MVRHRNDGCLGGFGWMASGIPQGIFQVRDSADFMFSALIPFLDQNISSRLWTGSCLISVSYSTHGVCEMGWIKGLLSG